MQIMPSDRLYWYLAILFPFAIIKSDFFYTSVLFPFEIFN